MKKGQVSIFIVIGVILLLLAAIFIFVSNRSSQIPGGVDNTELSPVINYVDSCIEQTATQGLVKLGRQGRLYSNAYLTSDTQRVAFFYYEGDGFFPTQISIIENDISRYIKEHLHECTSNFDTLDYEIQDDYEAMRVSTAFNNEDMQIEVTYPLVVTVGDSTTQLQEFSTSVDIRFRPIYELSRNIYQKTKQDPEWIDVSYLSSQPYPIRLIRVSDDTLVYEISDSFDSTEFVYRFAMKYNL